jgi:hypothetical protein
MAPQGEVALDASGTWLLPGGSFIGFDRVLDYLVDGVAVVPLLLWHDMRSCVVIPEARDRIDP